MRSRLITLALLLWTQGLHAETPRSIASPAQLQQALLDPAGGRQIVLSGGDYGTLVLKDLTATAETPLVLRSADPGKPARFSGLILRNLQNVVLEGLVLDYTFQAEDPLWQAPFRVELSHGVTLRELLIDGDRAWGRRPEDEGFPTGIGLAIRGSEGVTVENSEIRGFHRGLTVNKSAHVTLRGNDLHDLRMDGMNFSQVQNLLVEGNQIHDFARSLSSGDHADMIQFWTTRTTEPSRDIAIRGNLLNSGQGWFTQSIFMRNEKVDLGEAGKELYYRDVLIEDNVIINAHLHGISVGETDGLTIRNNTVVRNAASAGAENNPKLWTPRITVAQASHDVEISHNVTSAIVGPEGQPDWRVEQNILVQDRARMEPGFYGTVFLPAALRAPDRPGSFAARPGGPLDGSGIGAQWLNGGK
ncbi:Right handed beta helix region [Puniceibacterium sp. IMCC21224]|nr:Right handed beta helix region [Puniceibacterium sp. IMCC21224]